MEEYGAGICEAHNAGGRRDDSASATANTDGEDNDGVSKGTELKDDTKYAESLAFIRFERKIHRNRPLGGSDECCRETEGGIARIRNQQGPAARARTTEVNS